MQQVITQSFKIDRYYGVTWRNQHHNCHFNKCHKSKHLGSQYYRRNLEHFHQQPSHRNQNHYRREESVCVLRGNQWCVADRLFDCIWKYRTGGTARIRHRSGSGSHLPGKHEPWLRPSGQMQNGTANNFLLNSTALLCNLMMHGSILQEISWPEKPEALLKFAIEANTGQR